MTLGISTKFSEKMSLMIIIKVTKGFNLSLEDVFLEKPHRVGLRSAFPFGYQTSMSLVCLLRFFGMVE